MPFEAIAPRRIAVIGAGVSGLAAAYMLSRDHQVTLFEAEGRLGGHARTVMAGQRGDVAVDTGFIVFNYHTYPHLTQMFAELDVPVKKSNMSFGVSIDDGAVEYGMHSIAAGMAQKTNFIRPGYYRMWLDILKFNKRAVEVASDPDMTLGELLDELNLGRWFREYYLLPMSGAIWSTTPEQMNAFPARALVQFFENHALLTPNTHQWYTVDGGSIEYVRRMAAAIEGRGGVIRTGAPIDAVQRGPLGVSVKAKGQEAVGFDEVVFACHSDQALSLMADASPLEKSILGRVKYQPNKAVLHCDTKQMPKRQAAWSSWIYRTNTAKPEDRIGITYWMNSLQGIDVSEPMFVSLNPAEAVRDEYIYDEVQFAHPVFDGPALQAQQELELIQGNRGTWFCGAWTRHGFHEDGYASAVAIADRVGALELAA